MRYLDLQNGFDPLRGSQLIWTFTKPAGKYKIFQSRRELVSQVLTHIFIFIICFPFK